MPDKKTNLKKLNNQQVDKLKGKLIEVRRAGAHPIFVEVGPTDTVEKCFEKADIPTEDHELKVDGLREGKRKWEKVELKDTVSKFQKLAVTTKVRGSY